VFSAGSEKTGRRIGRNKVKVLSLALIEKDAASRSDKETNMKVLNNLKVQHKCQDCSHRADSFFCCLPQTALQTFEALKVTNAYPKDSMLFMEGQPANGIYMLCQGRVKLSTCSQDGKVIILRIAEAGEVLGLSANVSGSEYEATAEALEPCQVNFIRKDDFLRFLRTSAASSLNAVKQLSGEYHTAYTQICSLGLSNSVSDKLAKLFLGWCKTNGNCSGNGNENGNGEIHLKISYTHEEIAEMIGTSRETVTRLLTGFKKRKLISLKGSELVIHSRERLESTIGTRVRAK
jgi:CRP/FNR family transcriptional regulator, cyclic AMP receptor protein